MPRRNPTRQYKRRPHHSAEATPSCGARQLDAQYCNELARSLVDRGLASPRIMWNPARRAKQAPEHETAAAALADERATASLVDQRQEAAG